MSERESLMRMTKRVMRAIAFRFYFKLYICLWTIVIYFTLLRMCLIKLRSENWVKLTAFVRKSIAFSCDKLVWWIHETTRITLFITIFPLRRLINLFYTNHKSIILFQIPLKKIYIQSGLGSWAKVGWVFLNVLSYQLLSINCYFY